MKIASYFQKLHHFHKICTTTTENCSNFMKTASSHTKIATIFWNLHINNHEKPHNSAPINKFRKTLKKNMHNFSKICTIWAKNCTTKHKTCTSRAKTCTYLMKICKHQKIKNPREHSKSKNKQFKPKSIFWTWKISQKGVECVKVYLRSMCIHVCGA